MKKTVQKIFAAFLMLSLSSCLYMDTKFPLDTDVSTTKLGTKEGVSTSHSILWLVAWGDAGTEAAAKNGNITVINHMDRKSFMILFGLYSRLDTIVYGD